MTKTGRGAQTSLIGRYLTKGGKSYRELIINILKACVVSNNPRKYIQSSCSYKFRLFYSGLRDGIGMYSIMDLSFLAVVSC